MTFTSRPDSPPPTRMAPSPPELDIPPTPPTQAETREQRIAETTVVPPTSVDDDTSQTVTVAMLRHDATVLDNGDCGTQTSIVNMRGKRKRTVTQRFGQ